MRIELHDALEEASRNNTPPYVIAYNRIDGPGSSLDLREFQQAMWSVPKVPQNIEADVAAEWSRLLPRTVGITIDLGTKIEARPLRPDLIGVRSVEYATDVQACPGHVAPTKENWLLKIIDIFGLAGVQFVLHNLRSGIQSSGLGGSATATTGVCILANELAGRPLGPIQLVSMASRMEQDLGVSLTGTQEQSNVVFGGVTDYIWFPWGVPGRPESGYGESIRFELVKSDHYQELSQRMAIFHSGRTRASTDVNSIWMKALCASEGYQLHQMKLEIAYRFRESLRLRRWDEAVTSISDYRNIRTRLCPSYMDGATEILGFAEENGCATFPLGAGGGGGILIFASEPQSLQSLRRDFSATYREITFQILDKGHRLFNLPLERG